MGGGRATGPAVTDRIVNQGELGAAREFFTSDYVLHKAGLSVPRGPEAFKMAIRQWRDAFPDYRVEVTAVLADSDRVAVQFVATGTHTGSWLGIPPTGKSFRFTGTDVHRMVAGLVAETWAADDIPRIQTELGIMAPTNVGTGQWT